MRRKDRSISAKFGVSGELEQLAGRLKMWRKSQGRARRLPDELWAQAVAVARQEGVYRTARTLRLDYANLKRRAEAAQAITANPPDKRKASQRSDHILSLATSRASGPPAFIELLTDSIANDCLIEVEGGGGRMRIQMKLSASEVMSLVRDWQANPERR